MMFAYFPQNILKIICSSLVITNGCVLAGVGMRCYIEITKYPLAPWNRAKRIPAFLDHHLYYARFQGFMCYIFPIFADFMHNFRHFFTDDGDFSVLSVQL